MFHTTLLIVDRAPRVVYACDLEGISSVPQDTQVCSNGPCDRTRNTPDYHQRRVRLYKLSVGLAYNMANCIPWIKSVSRIYNPGTGQTDRIVLLQNYSIRSGWFMSLKWWISWIWFSSKRSMSCNNISWFLCIPLLLSNRTIPAENHRRLHCSGVIMHTTAPLDQHSYIRLVLLSFSCCYWPWLIAFWTLFFLPFSFLFFFFFFFLHGIHGNNSGEVGCLHLFHFPPLKTRR